ncbi:unnamed protein product [Sphagnum tenellum]
MVTTSCRIKTGIVHTTLEAPMEKTQGIVVAGRCTMVSFQGLKAGTVVVILNIWSSALQCASLLKLAASTGAFSSGTLLSKIFSSSLGCFFTYLKIVAEAALKIAGVL